MTSQQIDNRGPACRYNEAINMLDDPDHRVHLEERDDMTTQHYQVITKILVSALSLPASVLREQHRPASTRARLAASAVAAERQLQPAARL
jgi:hypothetical protein